MVSQFKNKITVLHDFNLDLKMYNLTNLLKNKLNKDFNNKIKFISTKEKKKN